MSWAVLSASTRFACLTAATRVDSCGLPDAAVATGTLAIAAKLPGFDGSVGTAAQPAPNSPVAVAGAIDGASAGAAEGAAAGAAAAGAGAAGAGAGAGAAAAPQADRETAQTEAAVTTANFRARIRDSSLREMGSDVLTIATARDRSDWARVLTVELGARDEPRVQPRDQQDRDAEV